MTWMLTASGHPGIGADARALEEKLVAELRAVLSKPEYKAIGSWFRGMHTAHTDLHQAPQISAAADTMTGTMPARVADPTPAAEAPGTPAPGA